MYMLVKDEDRIYMDFLSAQPLYHQLEDLVAERLEAMVKDHHFFVMEITHRVKTPESLRTKLLRKEGKYHRMQDITDLCGFRIICYFSDTPEQIAEALREIFVIDEQNSQDLRSRLADTQFGYLSLHQICSLKPEDTPDPALAGIRFEIQIRTVLQHAWAEIEHDLGYKSESGIPGPIRREFSRVAGLLEIADNQFMSLRDNIARYNDDIRERIRTGNGSSITLDRVSLRLFIEESGIMQRLLGDLNRSSPCGVEFINSDSYLKKLKLLGKESIGDLTALFTEHYDAALSILQQEVSELDLEFVTSNMVLRIFCYEELISHRYPRSFILRYVQVSERNPERAESKTDQICAVMEKKALEPAEQP